MVALFARRVATYPGDGMGTTGAATTLRLNLSRPDPWAMEHLRAMLPEAIAEAASGRWREPVAALLESKGTPRAIDLAATVAEPGRERRGAARRARLAAVAGRRRRGARAAGRPARGVVGGRGRDVEIAYSYKTNRTTAFLRAFADDGAGAEVVCAAEYALARDVVGIDGERITVNGPAKPDALLARAAADGALVIADSAPELERLALAGVSRAGLRVGLPGPEGTPSRFGIAPAQIVAAGRRARELGLTLEVLHVHLVSTDFTAPLGAEGRHAGRERPGRLGQGAGRARAGRDDPGPARRRARRRRDRHRRRHPRRAVAGGRRPRGGGRRGPARRRLRRAPHARAGARARRRRGRPRMTVVAVKTLGDGSTCAVLDAGTNLLPGALWAWPRLEALTPRGGATRRRSSPVRCA